MRRYQPARPRIWTRMVPVRHSTVLAKRLAGADVLDVTAYSTGFGALFLIRLSLIGWHSPVQP